MSPRIGLRVRRLPSRRQHGVVMILVLIGLVAMTLAGIALIRGSQTSSMIAGNFAFRQASLATADTAVELAFAQLDTIVAGLAESSYPGGCAVGACTYYPTRQATDANGVPTVVGDWSLVPANVVNTSYRTQYVIDRLCKGPTPVTDKTINCFVGVGGGGGGSRKVGDTNFSATQQVNYRVSVRVTGPRNTISFVQAIVAK